MVLPVNDKNNGPVYFNVWEGMDAVLTPATCRAARGLLDWSQQDLADRAGVGITAVRTFERGKSSPMAQNLAALARSIEAGGVEFIDPNGGGAGVRMREPSP